MTVLREQIEIEQPTEVAFDAVADFSSAEAWDPGVLRAERVREGHGDPSGVGATYHLTVAFRGAESRMTYVTTRYERPGVIVLEGEGPRIAARDTIRFRSSQDGGTRIDYEADLRLKGLSRLAEPLLGRAFDRMGKRALAGMRSWFASR